MSKSYIATALNDYNEDEYVTVLELAFKTKREAEEYLKGYKAHVKFVKEVEHR